MGVVKLARKTLEEKMSPSLFPPPPPPSWAFFPFPLLPPPYDRRRPVNIKGEGADRLWWEVSSPPPSSWRPELFFLFFLVFFFFFFSWGGFFFPFPPFLSSYSTVNGLSEEDNRRTLCRKGLQLVGLSTLSSFYLSLFPHSQAFFFSSFLLLSSWDNWVKRKEVPRGA